MDFHDFDIQRSHKLPGESYRSLRSGSLPHITFNRSRKASTISSATSVAPSFSSNLSYSTYPSSASIRDEPASPDSIISFESIVDDPFFQRYVAVGTSDDFKVPPPRSPPIASPTRDATGLSPTSRPRGDSLNKQDSHARPRTLSKTMESINIAIIGANGVGKSHFIHKSMGLPRVPGPQPTTARMTVDHVPYAVTIFELDLEYFDVEPNRQIKWPKQVGGAMMPTIHGVLLLYDVMNRDSILELRQTLNALVNSSLPTVLVATKCDNSEDSRQVDAEAVAAACQSCLANFKISDSKPESARLALTTLLKALIAARQVDMVCATANSHSDEASEYAGPRRRAASAHLDAPLDASNGRPLSQHSKHSRASSDMSLLRGIISQSGKEHGNLYRLPRIDFSGGHGNFFQDQPGEEGTQTVSSMLRNPGVRLERQNTASFMETDESDIESLRYSEDIPILQRNDEIGFERPPKKAGVSFDELVDRLLAPKMSRADHNFCDIFLCLYRKFTPPGQLFSAILSRLDRVKDDKSLYYLTKISTQLRIIEAVAKWVSNYPGDFARPSTRKRLEDFIRNLSTEPIFAAAAQQMLRVLEYSVVEDDDTGWAKADDAEDEAADFRDVNKISSELHQSMTSLSVEEQSNRRASQSSSLNTDSGMGSGALGKVHQFQFHSYEDYEREAATMVPTYTMPLTKFRYHIFMDTSDEDIADEMTRIDWVMFSSIRIRDLVRSVSLSALEKEKCKSLKNVNRMINHFNHVAKWAANMILMRDKAKHRAQMLEKFMNIALKLRQLNNYNGLAAVLAGINGSSIHRLAQTRALVPADVQKRFARLVLLMGTQKSHFAYRLAWENSPLPRIPFIPLHRRDLVSAEEGSMTFVGSDGNRINWKKFEVLGEVILPIMKSQGTPYPNLNKHDVARELILDCLMPTDEEDIYQRSVAVESSGAGTVDGSKKKFPWFANK